MKGGPSMITVAWCVSIIILFTVSVGSLIALKSIDAEIKAVTEKKESREFCSEYDMVYMPCESNWDCRTGPMHTCCKIFEKKYLVCSEVLRVNGTLVLWSII